MQVTAYRVRLDINVSGLQTTISLIVPSLLHALLERIAQLVVSRFLAHKALIVWDKPNHTFSVKLVSSVMRLEQHQMFVKDALSTNSVAPEV